MTERSNDEWIRQLSQPGPEYDEAVEALRVTLINGLRWGLKGWVKTIGPEFDALAEDFAQEALLKILDNLHTFRGDSKFTTWAHKIAVRVGLTELRRKRWRDTSLEGLLESEDGSIMTPSFMADQAPGPGRTAEQQDMIRRVQRIVLEDLTERQRTAIIATQIRGLPMDQVAESMAMNRNALYKLLHDARMRLKKRLAVEGISADEVLATFE